MIHFFNGIAWLEPGWLHLLLKVITSAMSVLVKNYDVGMSYW